MTNDRIEQALDRATHLMDELVTIKDFVGDLDDLYETEYIDNRLLSDLGAYQHITYALRQLQNYVWQIKEEVE
jgi:conjugal transfer/entry exclusion protein